MLIATFGPPSAFTQWCIHISRVFLDEALTHLDYCNSSVFGEFRAHWQKRANPHFFYFSDCPDRAIVELFRSANGPMIVFLEDPADVVGFAVRERQISWTGAVRLTSQTFSAIQDVCLSPTAVVIRRSEGLTVFHLIQTLASVYDIELTPELVRAVRARLEFPGTSVQDMLFEIHLLDRHALARPIGMGLDGFTDDERAAIEMVIEPYRSLLAGRPISHAIWPKIMFMAGDRPDQPLHHPIDLTGPSRCVFYGPFLHLPPGTWTARVEFAVAGNQSGNIIRADIYTDQTTMMADFDLPVSGHFKIDLDFVVEDARLPLQVRFITMQGAIEGEINLVVADVWRTEVVVGSRNYLSSELSEDQRGGDPIESNVFI